MPDSGEAPRLICSAQGCRREAAWALLWNNPRLHAPQRRKTWLACDDHRDTLTGFLTLRGFLRETVPAAEAGQAAADGTVAGSGSGSGSGATAGTQP